MRSPPKAVATANAAQSTMSSSTATPNTSRAKRVWRILRSAKILEITGTDVTATATAEIMINETLFPFGPAIAAPTRSGPDARPIANGIPVPTIASQPTSRRSSRLNNCFVSAPERNINKSNPIQ